MARLGLGIVSYGKRGAIWHLVPFALPSVVVRDDDLAIAGDRDLLFSRVGNVAHRGSETHHSVGFGFHRARNGSTRCRAADVERSHRELRPRLTDGLRGDDADRFAHVDKRAATEVASVALRAKAVARFACQGRANLHLVDPQGLDPLDTAFVQKRSRGNDRLLRLWMQRVGSRDAPQDPFTECLDDLSAFHQGFHDHAVRRAAIVLDHHEILSHVDESAGQVARVGGLERRVRKPLSRTVRGDEVLEHIQSLAEVRGNRRLDDGTIGFGHQPTHAGQLPDLRRGTSSAGVGHHVNGIERLLRGLLALAVDDLLVAELVHHRLGDLIPGPPPDVDDLVVPLALGHETGRVLTLDLLNFLFRLVDDGRLLSRNEQVVDANRKARARRVAEARVHQLVGENYRLADPAATESLVDEPRDLLLLEGLVDDRKRKSRGQYLRKKRPSHGRFMARDYLGELAGFLAAVLADPYRDLRVQLHATRLVGATHLRNVGKKRPLAARVHAFSRGVVEAQDDVLRRHDHRLPVGGMEHVVGRKHERPGFHLRLERDGHVNGHLVAVEVGVERGADERMQLDRLPLDQHGLECLDAQPVERRRPVEQHRVLPDNVLEDVPHHRLLALHHALGRLDGRRQPHHLQLVEDERLEQFERHELGQPALVELQCRPHHDHGAARVVDALAEQVLAETAALALDHVR